MQKVSSFRQSLLPKNTITQPDGRTTGGRNRGRRRRRREMAEEEEDVAGQPREPPSEPGTLVYFGRGARRGGMLYSTQLKGED